MIGISTSGNAQQLCVAFYNQENLFDTLDTPGKNDEEYTPSGTYQWNTYRYENKLQNMAKVISAMNQGKGPDVLGMCEVENDLPLKGLATVLKGKGVDYRSVWFDSQDERGIDNALFYKPSLLTLLASHAYLIDNNGIGGDHTRSIVLALFQTKNKGKLAVLVNHFPSRREGETQSEYKRLFVAGRLIAIADSLRKTDEDMAVLIMGDFNDYPNNQSMSTVLRGKKTVGEVSDKDFFNPMYALMEAGQGSYRHKGEWNFLDQMLLNEELVEKGNKLTYVANSAAVFKESWMLETEEKYKGNPLRTFGGKRFLNGYSDHLPVYLYLKMK